jgi:hypothetical protein
MLQPFTDDFLTPQLQFLRRFLAGVLAFLVPIKNFAKTSKIERIAEK